MIDKDYRTTASSIWFTVIVLPFILLFMLFGIANFVAGGFNPFSIVFTGLGVLAAFSALNYSWSRTKLTTDGIYKSNLLSRKRFVPWSNIESWRYVEDSETDIESVEFRLKSKKRFTIYVNEAESHGMDELMSDLRSLIGELEIGVVNSAG